MSKQRHRTAALRKNAEAYLRQLHEAELALTHVKVECSFCRDDDWPFDDCPKCFGRGWLLRRIEDIPELQGAYA